MWPLPVHQWEATERAGRFLGPSVAALHWPGAWGLGGAAESRAVAQLPCAPGAKPHCQPETCLALGFVFALM